MRVCYHQLAGVLLDRYAFLLLQPFGAHVPPAPSPCADLGSESPGCGTSSIHSCYSGLPRNLREHLAARCYLQPARETWILSVASCLCLVSCKRLCQWFTMLPGEKQHTLHCRRGPAWISCYHLHYQWRCLGQRPPCWPQWPDEAAPPRRKPRLDCSW